MKKQIKVIGIISGVLLGLIVLYLAGGSVLASRGLEWHSRILETGKGEEHFSTRQYKSDEAKVIQAVRWAFDSMRIETYQDRAAVRSEIEKMAAAGAETLTSANSDQDFSDPVPSPEPERTQREMVEGEYPEQCQAAQAIWEAALKDAGYGYEPGANAKGNLVIWLGKLPGDNLQSDTEESDYYLTYDRESKNGNCYLFVLSEVPEGHGLNDAYLREFYACEKDTWKVVAGDKTSWAETGCAEYREITGE